MKRLGWLVVGCCIGLSGALAAEERGFLEDYDRLETVGLPRGQVQAYTAPGAEGRVLGTLYVETVREYPAGASFPGTDAATVDSSLRFLQRELQMAIGGDRSLATGPAGADAVLSVAVTHIDMLPKGHKPRDLIPLRLVTNALKTFTMGEPLVAVATVEFKLTDARTGEVLREGVRHFPGDDIGRAGDAGLSVSYEALEPALKDAATFLAKATGPKL